ncbi:hypothetical protein G6F70_000835 [Rhizopus microsporus]|uniref:Uncharacterized protein n=2 Tax=Rhizopus TaxID=4842 RepID=A0A367K5U6_RHIAZ|nr:hypothetical protein G6F71_000551 [Rhizopus microsporus]RCH97535.1 hypothetical protein CU097_004716 [Rhizopus azygosporus]KAG1204002.1 hypothetical protein G6F70_000835 [Rhizopus microsporus]KAG1208374.1 hypothetical protein G6F69_007268 [Rhizopus microsporus]KAG1229688.1 hypothetical protein G6F67_006972 [Rhizopus microsporus]
MDIWNYCFRHLIKLSTLYVPLVCNRADSPSRQLQQQIEWILSRSSFDWLEQPRGPHSINLFASLSNHQLPGSMDKRLLNGMIPFVWSSISCSTLEHDSPYTATTDATPTVGHSHHAQLATSTMVSASSTPSSATATHSHAISLDK